MKPTLYIDIETLPGDEAGKAGIEVKAPGQYKKQDSIDKWLAENGESEREAIYRKQSFNGGYGQVCQISWAIDDGEICGESLGSDRDGEKDMLASALASIEIALGHATSPDICGHFISGFDLKFIKHRCIVLGIKYPHWLKPNAKPWDVEIRDTMILWAGARDTISLDNLCKILGIEGKGDVDGSMVYDMWLDGKHEEIAAYCADDVEKVRQVNKRFIAAGI